MKKRFFLLLFALLLLPVNIKAEENTELIKNATSGLLMEQSTGEIIFEKDKDKQVAVASMTKMVAQTIILENIESGKIKWDDIVSVSKNAADMGGSQIYLTAGEKMSVKDLFKGISMASANDATVAMAEYIAGDEASFVKLMNKKVKELGLKNTTFKNSTGLDEEGHLSTAYDMAIIARNLLNHEKILDFSSVYEDYLRQDTENKFWLVNTNKLLKQYQGVDGLKTGYTKEAGYCIVTTCKKDNLRLIGVLMNEDKPQTRNEDMKGLLNYGYSKYQQIKLYSKGEVLDTLKIKDLVDQEVKVITPKDIYYLNDRASKGEVKTKIKYNQIELPVFKKQEIGELVVKKQNKTIASYSLYLEKDVKKMNFLDKLLRVYKSLI